MNAPYIVVNDKLYTNDEALLQVNDLAVQRGYAVFDFFRIHNSQPVFLNDHLSRLYQSAAIMQLPLSYSQEQLSGLIYELMQKNNLPESGMRLTITGGYSPNGYDIATPNLIITQQPLHINADKGLHLITHQYQRQLPAVKTIDYLMAIYLKKNIELQKADDILYCNGRFIRECPRANFFVVLPGKKVVTPGTDILQGITRRQLLHNIAGHGVHVFETDVTMDDLEQAEEAFVTSTTKSIQPVITVNGRPVGVGKAGPVTLLLQRWFQQTVNHLTV